MQSPKPLKTYHNYVKKVSLDSASVLSIGLVLVLLSTVQVSAQPLVKDTPTGNLTGGDISISPGEPLPANGTVSVSTGGATDTDMEAFPPEGVTVIISSDTVTVTNQAVDIGGDEEQSDEDEGDDGGGVNGDEGAGGDGGDGSNGDGGDVGDGGVGGDGIDDE
jgi:hypothetical protein